MVLNLHLHSLSIDLVALVASFAWDLDSASAAGHLEIVQLLLHLDRSSPVRCSFRALNAAAQNGFLYVFLHFHRSEGCTSYAMDAAAAKGHLEVVKFLHFHRTEGCTTAAMDLAAAQGHLQVVDLLEAGEMQLEHCYETEDCWFVR
ncbi:Ankyrin repeat-containing domain [Phytophthora cactorum]|nr:Ankyrin repeat-containing domain [Phytophthora cactorum]